MNETITLRRSSRIARLPGPAVRAAGTRRRGRRNTKYQAINPEEEVERHKLEPMNHRCPNCNALKYPGESSGFCCADGKVVLAPYPPIPRKISSFFKPSCLGRAFDQEILFG
jgi:hypothetical protein